MLLHVTPLFRWPLPALFTWISAWGWYALLQWAGAPLLLCVMLPTLWGALLTVVASNLWRRTLIGLGFPLSLALSGAVALPAWAWLLPLALILLIYPLNAWRDAPLFPTPAQALREMPLHVSLPDGAWVLDAGCGLGDGLKALRQAFPHVHLHGLEWSWPLRAACALRCPWARVRQGDIWKADWSPYALVYLFQRPESMPRAVEKAAAELKAGQWLVSLEFEAQALQPQAVVYGADGRPVWMYQAPFKKAKPLKEDV